ncbi:MAG: GFA family protein [Sphingomonas sp.]|jgi:hypothetical protein
MNEDALPDLPGQCLCGDTAYRLSPPYHRVEACHCTQCRRAIGSALHMVVPVGAEQVHWLSRDSVCEYESTPGKFRAFCGRCGSPVYSRRADMPESLRMRAGLILDLPEPAELVQGHVEDALPWINAVARMIAEPLENTR